jgi:hypothetical protein
MFRLNHRLRPPASWGRLSLSSRNAKRRNRRFRPMVGSEPLEPRIAMSHATIQLGAVQPGQNSSFASSVARNSTKDYQFQVNAPIIVGATLSGLSSNAEVMLLNANKVPLASFSNGRANDSFTYTFSPGVYYARVVDLGRHKAKYEISVTASALPTPAPAPTPTLTPSSPSAPTGSNSGGTTSKITVEQFATNLAAVTQKVMHQFALDATTVEALAPTTYSTFLVPELEQVDSDVLNNNDFQGFADLVSLGQTMLQEAQFTTKYGLPNGDALLGYSKVVTDLINVGAVKEITYAFIDYLASKLPTPSTGSTPTYLTSGVLGSGNSGNLLSQTNQAALTAYSVPSLNNLASFYNNNLSGDLPSDDEYSEDAQDDFSTTTGIQEDNTESVDLGDDVGDDMDDIDPWAGYTESP